MSTTAIEKVLIFDTDNFYRRVIYNLLLSFEVPAVVQAAEYSKAANILKIKSFDLIVMDWDMDGGSRLDLVKNLRNGKLGPNIWTPVLLCSAHNRKSRIYQARDAGISEIVAKPVSPQQMLDKMRASCFRMRRFVRSENFSGPDRRRRSVAYLDEDRRSKVSMDQDDIDAVMRESE